MPSKVAENVRNWATVIRLPEAISWSSAIRRAIKANATATRNDSVAIALSSSL